MCAFRFHFWGRKVNWNQASHVRASSVPTLYTCCLTKRSCHVLFVARVGLCCWFCDFAVSFLVPPDGPKYGTVKVLFFCSFTKLCMRSQKMGPPGGPIFGTVFRFIFWSFLYQGCGSATFGFNEALWLMATGRATREALLSEAGFEKVFRTQNWVHRSKLFCRWFCFLLGQAGCISVAAWTQLKVAFYYFVSSGGLIVCCWTKAHQPFAALGDCLKCFLLLRSLWVFAQVVGFHLNDCIEYFTAPCWPPLPL